MLIGAQFADLFFKELGEPDHKLARWTQGTEPFEMWSRESIKAALSRLEYEILDRKLEPYSRNEIGAKNERIG